VKISEAAGVRKSGYNGTIVPLNFLDYHRGAQYI
jgi:hypothetical protein